MVLGYPISRNADLWDLQHESTAWSSNLYMNWWGFTIDLDFSKTMGSTVNQCFTGGLGCSILGILELWDCTMGYPHRKPLSLMEKNHGFLWTGLWRIDEWCFELRGMIFVRCLWGFQTEGRAKASRALGPRSFGNFLILGMAWHSTLEDWSCSFSCLKTGILQVFSDESKLSTPRFSSDFVLALG
jgi:hypothetical protein